jgi:hypothetical protein
MAINKTVRNAIADGAVTSDKIEDGAITSGKLGAGTISLSKTPLGNAAPTISSLNTSQIDPDSGATVTITGTGFVSIPDVRFLNTSTGARIQASTVGFTSSTTITGAFPSGQTPGTYKVLVENPDGKGVISTSTITYSAAPTWSTAANLGSIEEGEAVNIQLLAYDDDSTAVSSYSLQSGSLPSGVTLSGDSSVGSLIGTAPAVDADTNYTFTIRATDDEGQTSDREFTLTITNWTVANSLRFNDDDLPVLERIPSTSSNQKTFTYSFWVKRGNISTAGDLGLVGARVNGDLNFHIVFENSNQITSKIEIGGTSTYLTTNALYRDPSAWYHIVFAVDTTQATASNRVKLYVNGEQVTSFSTETYPVLNGDTSVNTGTQYVGAITTASNIDGYMAEVCLIDGQQLTPSSFGETDTASGIWKPKQISGLTFGTNGFYLNFLSSATIASLGLDQSGNGNDFTVYNLGKIDQTTDTPVNNYATLNPLVPNAGTLANGNLDYTGPTGDGTSYSTIGVSSGKWYWEVKLNNTPNKASVGIMGDADPFQYNTNGGLYSPRSYSYYPFNGSVYTNNTTNGDWSASTTSDDGDIIGIAMDLDNGYVYFSKNGSFMNSGVPTSGATGTGGVSLTTGNDFFPIIGDNTGAGSEKALMNFGNPPFTISSGNADANGYGNFEYAVPSGYFALNTKNLAEYG